MSFFSTLYSKVFKKEMSPIQYCSITNPDIYQVKLEDIRKLVEQDKYGNLKLTAVHLKVPTNTINTQLKLLYTFHMMLLFDDQMVVQTVSQWIENGEIKPQKIEELVEILQPTTYVKQKKRFIRHNHSLTVPNEKDMDQIVKDQNSMCMNFQQQEKNFSHILELEWALIEYYYNYLQRLSWGIDIIQSSKIKQYPYPSDQHIDTKQKFLWLYKIINLLNYQISGIQLIKYNLQHISLSTPLIKELTSQILKDCVIEYEFLSAEVTEMIESISSMHVSDALQFYEVYQILKDQTKVLRDFYNQRDRFQQKFSESYDVQWFQLTKDQKVEVEDYICKIKFLHTGSFRKSLNIPSKNAALELLRNQLIQYQIDPKALKDKNKKIKNMPFVSAKNSNQIKFQFNPEVLFSTRYQTNNNLNQFSSQKVDPSSEK